MNSPKIYKYNSPEKVARRIKDDFVSGKNDFIFLYAYNGIGKTSLSMEFKNLGKRKGNSDTLYFNAFTEDLFTWDNDLDDDTNRELVLNTYSKFFPDLMGLEIAPKIRNFLDRYCDFDFIIEINKKIDKVTKKEIEYWAVNFKREVIINGTSIIREKIKVSRGEENIFKWCFFLAIVQLVIDEHVEYNWVKYFYIDDPISSLDDNNAVAVASDLAVLLRNHNDKVKSIISSHHGLFYNVICNELKDFTHKKYFMYRNKATNELLLQASDDTPFFHHVAMIYELKKANDTQKLYAYHFNILRNVLEKTSSFFGYKDFSDCIKEFVDINLYSRALNLLSHGGYSLYEPKEMVNDNKKIFSDVFEAFLEKYDFELPKLD